MTWYSRIKLANAAQKLKKLNITDPNLINFVNRFENRFDWNRIFANRQNATALINQQLQQFASSAREGMFGGLLTKEDLTPEKLSELSNVAEYKTFADHALQSGDSSHLIKKLNQEKMGVYSEWERALEPYKNDPIFCFDMFNMVGSSSAKSEEKVALRVDDSSLKAAYGRFKSGKETNIGEFYNKVLRNTVLTQLAQRQPLEPSRNGVWATLGPSEDPEVIKQLTTLSSDSGWCLAVTSHAKSYLTRNKFHILFQNFKPTACIRTKEGVIEEIKGINNNIPVSSAVDVTDYIDDNELISEDDPSGMRDKDGDYGLLLNSIKLNKTIATPQGRQKLLSSGIRYNDVKLLTAENLKDPEIRQLCINSFLESFKSVWGGVFKVESALSIFGNEPSIIAGAKQVWLKMVQKQPSKEIIIPDIFKNDPEFDEAVKTGWIDSLRQNPEKIEKVLNKYPNDPDLINKITESLRQFAESESAKYWSEMPGNALVEKYINSLPPEKQKLFEKTIWKSPSQQPKNVDYQHQPNVNNNTAIDLPQSGEVSRNIEEPSSNNKNTPI